ncbi:C13 family peptidase [Alloacidobacterium sp.]|uniref:C13 family peptidase n=1 Tax=Alloacidobacterium sp. TaxID=2951999 RepID=UPI002D276F52|nr:C13 family peptidase [Alloacidobacterium sp.]HYK37790.1 C13 family peptidase [Alloacidobacterium sp.]
MRAAGDKVIDWGNKTLCGSLENESATKAAILSCLGKIANSVKPSDMVILSLAEHGTTRGNELFYYIPHSDGKEIEGISSAELADVFRKLQARRIIVIVDACDSGAAIAPLQQAILARVATAASLRGKQPDGQSTSDA